MVQKKYGEDDGHGNKIEFIGEKTFFMDSLEDGDEIVQKNSSGCVIATFRVKIEED